YSPSTYSALDRLMKSRFATLGRAAGVLSAGPLPARTPEAPALRRPPADVSGGRVGSLRCVKFGSSCLNTPGQCSSQAARGQGRCPETGENFFAMVALLMPTVDDTLRRLPPQSLEAEESV